MTENSKSLDIYVKVSTNNKKNTLKSAFSLRPWTASETTSFRKAVPKPFLLAASQTLEINILDELSPRAYIYETQHSRYIQHWEGDNF